MATGTALIDYSFAPSLAAPPQVTVTASFPAAAGACGVPIKRGGPVPAVLGVELARLESAGFDASVGSALVLPSAQFPALVAYGLGDPTGPRRRRSA